MKIITKYLLVKYIKYFFIILISLELFFCGIDFMQHLDSLPHTANLQLMYIVYNMFFILTIALPLSLVFAWVILLSFLIKSNSLVSFYALGISHKMLLQPIGLIAGFIVVVLIFLQMTPLAYSYNEKNKILSNKYFVNDQKNIFLKYNDYYIYFKKLRPYKKEALDVHIFKIKDDKIIQVLQAQKAIYRKDKWYVTNANIIDKPVKINWEKSKLFISFEKFLPNLANFKPEIITKIYKGDAQYSIIDAINTILLLDKQEFNTNKIRSILYSQIVIPFFVIPLIVLIFLFVSPSSRFFNMGLFISSSIFLSLLVWGLLFLLQKLALSGVLNAELAILLPIFILSSLSIYLYNKKVE